MTDSPHTCTIPEEHLPSSRPPTREYFHLTNMRTPLDVSSQACLMALDDGYRLSLPIEAEPNSGFYPVPQAIMIQNGIIGLYVTLEAAQRPAMAPHLPASQLPLKVWLPMRPSIVAQLGSGSV